MLGVGLVRSILVSDLMMLDNPTIVDVRAFYYYNLGHIEGAISIPYYNLLNNYSHYLSRYHDYYLYCDTGRQSYDIVLRLSEFGYRVYDIVGGYKEYLRLFGD